MTTIGVALGGVQKDLFQLPRPSATIVQRPSNLDHDATGAKDFGYVSTHTVNSVTNAGVVLL